MPPAPCTPKTKKAWDAGTSGHFDTLLVMGGGGLGRAMDVARQLANELGVFRQKDLEAAGISHSWIDMLTFTSVVQLQDPGVLVAPGGPYPLSVRAAVKWPNAVICGPSALHLHGLCDEQPRLWLAFDRGARAPRTKLPVRVLRCRQLHRDPEVTQLTLRRVRVPVFDVVRSLTDCLRMAEEIPPDLLRVALARAQKQGLADRQALLACAERRRCRSSVHRSFDLHAGR